MSKCICTCDKKICEDKCVCKYVRKGEHTCKRRGAPVKLCNPAPNVDKNDPIKITH